MAAVEFCEMIGAGLCPTADMFDRMPEPVFRLAPDGTLIYLNAACARIYGLDPVRAQGRKVFDLLPPPRARQLRIVLSQAARERGPVRHEVTAPDPSGRVGWLEWRIQPVYDGEILHGFDGLARDVTGRHQRADARRRQAERQRVGRHASEELSWELDLPSARLTVAGAWDRLLGLTRDDVDVWTLSDWHDRLHPGDREPLDRSLRDAWSHRRRRWSAEARFQRDDGRYVRILVRAVIEYDGVAPAWMAGAVRNITLQHEAERERDRLVQVLDNMVGGIGFATPDGRLQYLNRGGRALLGEPLDGALRRGRMADYASDPARLSQLILPTALREGSWSGRIRALHADGSIIPCTATFQVHRDERDEVEYISAVMQDAREEEASAAAMQASEERHRQAFEDAPVGLVVMDAEGNVQYMNRFLRELEGFTREQSLGANGLRERSSVESGMAANIRRCLDERCCIIADCRSISLTGVERQLHYHLAPLLTDDGQVRGVVDVMVDMTDRVRLEEQLRQAAKLEAVGQLAGGIAHDFNNILTAILGNARLLEDDPCDTGERATLQAEIIGGAERAARLTRQLLAFSRRDAIQPVVLDLNQVVRDLGSMLRRLIGETVELRLELAPDLHPVRADLGQIEQVLLNLITNARDAMPAGGVVTIRTSNSPADPVRLQECGDFDGVLIEVVDTGHGMSAEVVERVFEPFFTTKPAGRGTGLGLATVYGVVQQNGGRICCDSRVDEGTRFRIRLPRTARERVEPTTAEPTDRSAPRQATILLLEDEAPIRRLTCRILAGAGWQTIAAGTVAEARETFAAANGSIDLLISDVVLPDGNGHQLAGDLLAEQPDLAVLLISGYDPDTVGRHGVLQAGGRFLSKPFSPRELIGEVHALLEERGAA